MNYIVLLLGFAAFVSTSIGGIFAVRLRRLLPYFFAFAAGSLIAIAFFDIFPESLGIAGSLGIPVRYLMIALVGSYLFYNFLERFFLTHHFHEGHKEEEAHMLGPVGATGLVIHSFLDGIAIGVAFQVNAAIGIIVAFAVIFHDFNDGINTVTLMFRNKHKVRNAVIWLVLDAVAPVVGVLSTFAVQIPEAYLAIILAIFTGEFLYLGASSLLRETFEHEYWKMMVPMLAAVLLIFAVTSVV